MFLMLLVLSLSPFKASGQVQSGDALRVLQGGDVGQSCPLVEERERA